MDRAGAETMIMNLYRVIDRERFQFDFLYFTDDKCDFDEEITSLGGNIYRLPSEKYKNPLSRMFVLTRLLKKEKHIKIIHCHMLFSNAFHLVAGYLAGVNFRIAHSHSTSNKNNHNPLINLFYTKSSRLLINHFATQFIACGKEAGLFLFPYQKKPQFLPNAIDVVGFNSIGKSNKTYLRNLLNVPEDCLIVSQVGRMNAVKNHKFTLELAKYMKGINKNFHLVIIGNGPLKNELELKSLEYGLEKHITFLGLRKDIPQLLAGSDVMIMPSLYEGFPVVLVESQAAGTPALISTTISNEVDLKVGLVFFQGLSSTYQEWCLSLFKLKKNSFLDEEKRIKTISDKGFEINTSVKILEAIYRT